MKHITQLNPKDFEEVERMLRFFIVYLEQRDESPSAAEDVRRLLNYIREKHEKGEW